MARKSKSLAGAFTQFQEPEQKNVKEKNKLQVTQEISDVTKKPKDIKGNETVNSNTNSVTEDVIQKHNTATETSSTTNTHNYESKQEYASEVQNQESATKTIREVTNSLMSMYDEKSKKKTVEETHTRATFLFRKDLQERLNALADGKRGFKTMFMNKAIEALLDEMEDVEE